MSECYSTNTFHTTHTLSSIIILENAYIYIQNITPSRAQVNGPTPSSLEFHIRYLNGGEIHTLWSTMCPR